MPKATSYVIQITRRSTLVNAWDAHHVKKYLSYFLNKNDSWQSTVHYHQFTAAVKIQNLYLSYFPDSFLYFKQGRSRKESVLSNQWLTCAKSKRLHLDKLLSVWLAVCFQLPWRMNKEIIGIPLSLDEVKKGYHIVHLQHFLKQNTSD